MLRPVWVGVLVEMLSLFGSTSPFRFVFPSKSDALVEVEEVVVEAVAVHTINFNEFWTFIIMQNTQLRINLSDLTLMLQQS